jgi:hypothetical protein
MLVCLNGHVITDRLHSSSGMPSTHCDRCGATALDRCRTCGWLMRGAEFNSGLAPVGTRRPPDHCPACGAAFPWANEAPAAPVVDALSTLDQFLRRLPQAIRQLRNRRGDRPAFRVEDERDLEDLLRALLPLAFDDVRLESRTPAYVSRTRTDFQLKAAGLSLTVKMATREIVTPALGEQLEVDVRHYENRAACRGLVVLVFDPEGLVPKPRDQERAWSSLSSALEIHPIIAT